MLLFLVGLIASIPLAVAANLLTPRFQVALAKNGNRRKRKRIRKITEERARVERYREGTQGELLAFCAHRIVYTVIQFALIVVVDVGVFTALQAGSTKNIGNQTVAGLAVIFTFLLLNEAQRTMNFFRKIYRFEKYEAKVTRELAELGVNEQGASSEVEAVN